MVAEGAERGGGGKAGVERGHPGFILRGGRGGGVLIEILDGGLAFGDGGGAGLLLGFVLRGLLFRTCAAGFLVLHQAEAAGGDGGGANGVDHALAREPAEQHAARLQIVILNFGVQRVPKLFEKSTQQIEAFEKAGELFAIEGGFGEPDGELEVLGALGQRLARQVGDLPVVGGFALVLPLALRACVVLAARFLELIVNRVVAEIGAAGVITGDGVQQIGAKRHGSLLINSFGPFSRSELDFADVEERNVLAIDGKNTLTRRDADAVDFSPNGRAAQFYVVVGVTRGKGSEHGQEHLAQFLIFKRGAGADERGGPEEIAEALGSFEFDRFDVLEGNPQIGASGEELEAGAEAGVGVFESFKGPTIERAAAGIAGRGRDGIILLFEKIVADAFGVERGEIEYGADARIGSRVGEDVEVLLGAIVIALEAQQLEQKRAAPGVGRVVPYLDAQRLDRFVEFTGFEKLLSAHEGV